MGAKRPLLGGAKRLKPASQGSCSSLVNEFSLARFLHNPSTLHSGATPFWLLVVYQAVFGGLLFSQKAPLFCSVTEELAG